MKHSMDTRGFSRDSFPSPSPPPAAASPSLPGGVSVSSCSGTCGVGGDAHCVGGPCGSGFAAAGGAGDGWGGTSCPRGGVGVRPHGLAGTGGFLCAHEAEPAVSRRWSCARFAAGDGDLRPGSRRGGGGDWDARPRPPGVAAPWSRSRLARLSSPPGAALPCRHLGGLDGDRSGPATVVAADDSDAASDFSSTERAGLLTLPPTPWPSLALAFSADGATTVPPATRLALDRGLTRGVSESTSLTFSSSGGGRSRASTAFLPSAAPGGSPHFLLTQQPMATPSFALLLGL
ncbi:hypothetical protein VPH35_016139 [Triticum aestivum]|uniref:Uncharacterized protein n=1 Tax=Triticum aestivum TaxID=4565 RepID=A0A3B5ZYR5_WHEAT